MNISRAKSRAHLHYLCATIPQSLCAFLKSLHLSVSSMLKEYIPKEFQRHEYSVHMCTNITNILQPSQFFRRLALKKTRILKIEFEQTSSVIYTPAAKFVWSRLKIVNENIRRGCWIPSPGHTHRISHGQLRSEVVEASQRTETSRWNKPHVLFSVEPVGSNEDWAQFSRTFILLSSMHLNRSSKIILHRN